MRFSEEKEHVRLLPPLVGSYRVAPVPVLPRPERRRTVMRTVLSVESVVLRSLFPGWRRGRVQGRELVLGMFFRC